MSKESVGRAANKRRTGEGNDPRKEDVEHNSWIGLSGGKAHAKKCTDRNVSSRDGQAEQAGENDENPGGKVGGETLSMIHGSDSMAHGFCNSPGVEQPTKSHCRRDGEKAPPNIKPFQEEQHCDDFWGVI